jgi:UDPglucose 6-dehydrogenase
MRKYTVGIIGNGFVGDGQAFVFSANSEVRIYDINPLRATHTLEEVQECDFVFVAVPTPMREDGSQDLSYIENVFKSATSTPIYIIKSTVLPGTTQTLIEKYPNLSIVFNPEFLTERSAKVDALTQSRIVIGGANDLTLEVSKLYEDRFIGRKIIQTDATSAELVKYMANTFLATKVSIMNEFKMLADKLEVNWEDTLAGFAGDPRIGQSHLQVPGPDGHFGYGGTCFPKDVNALLTLSSKVGIPLRTIQAGWETNLAVRPEQDWKNDKGRAVSK